MRDILFRAKRVDNGEWVYGYYLFHVIKNKHIILTLGVSKFIEVIPETVGQFTGLLDKKGNQIFEGDKIKLLGGLRLEQYPDKGIIEYSGTSFSMKSQTISGGDWRFSLNFSDGTEIEIIGNIHDK